MAKVTPRGIVEMNWPCVHCGTLVDVQTYASGLKGYTECPKCKRKYEFTLQIHGVVSKEAKSQLIKSR